LDQVLYSYQAWAWRHFGQIPYKDTFDQNFPGIILVHYLVQVVLGESETAFRSFDIAWQTLTALLIYLIAGAVFKNRLSGFIAAVLYSIYYIDLGPWNSGQRDGLLVLLYLLSFWLLMPRREPRGPAYSALAGTLIGLGFLIKPVAAIAAVIFFALAIKYAKRKLPSLSAYVAGCITPSAACILYFWHKSALPALYEAVFLFPAKVYVDYGLFSRETLIAGIVMKNFLESNLAIIIGAGLLAAIVRRIHGTGRTNLGWLLLLWLGTYAGYLAQAKYFDYQQIPFWGFSCILAGGGWALAMDFLNEKWPAFKKAKALGLTITLIAASILLMQFYVQGYLMLALRESLEEGRDNSPYHYNCNLAGKYIQNRSGPSDKVQVWGGEAYINYIARRRAPSRLPITLHLLSFKPGREQMPRIQKQLVEEFKSEIQNDRPLYFVVTRRKYFRVDDFKTALVQEYPEIWEFIQNNYRLEATIGFVEIYRRNEFF
jgi:hypothetical protein